MKTADHVRFVCSLNYTWQELRVFTPDGEASRQAINKCLTFLIDILDYRQCTSLPGNGQGLSSGSELRMHVP